jgi:putative transcriptional regulator
MPVVRGSRRRALGAVARANWVKIDAMTDKDIGRQIAGDQDAAPDTSGVPRRNWRLVLPEPDVHRIRAKLAMTQDNSAAAFGVSVATVRNWEQGRRKPQGAARVLMTIIEREPAAVLRAIRPKARQERGGPS